MYQCAFMRVNGHVQNKLWARARKYVSSLADQAEHAMRQAAADTDGAQDGGGDGEPPAKRARKDGAAEAEEVAAARARTFLQVACPGRLSLLVSRSLTEHEAVEWSVPARIHVPPGRPSLRHYEAAACNASSGLCLPLPIQVSMPLRTYVVV